MRMRQIGLVAMILVASVSWGHWPHGNQQKCRWLLDNYNSCSLHDRLECYLPQPYRKRYNRPRYCGGAIAWFLEPSSQEALTWHHHVHRGTYDRCDSPPIIDRYCYPKPWEILPTGARACPKETSN
jgi:hypothetical protein